MPSDLVFDIIAKDQTRTAFDAANNNAKNLAKNVTDSGKSAAKGVDLARGSVANLAAQFQDITVQLQGGGSPFTVALQQGTQIGAVLGPMGAGGAVNALRAAFMSMLSPVNLITIGAIAAGGAMYQMLVNSQSEGIKAEDVLKNFDVLLQRIGQSSKASEDRIRAMMQAPSSMQGLLADTAAQIKNEQGLIKQQIDAAIMRMQSFVTRWEDVTPAVLKAQGGIRDLATALNSGAVGAKDALDQLDLMRTAQTTPLSLYETIDRLREILRTAASAEQRLNSLSNSGVLKGDRISGPAQASDRAANAGNTANMAARMGEWHEKLTDGLNRQTEALKPKKHAMSEDERAALRQEKAYQKVTQSLQDELAMIGKSTVDQRILELQRRAGVEATSSEGQAIANLVAQVDREKAAFKEGQQASKFFHDTFANSMMQLVPQIETGNKALDTFINKLAEAAFQSAFFGEGPLSGFFGSKGSGIFSLFGFGGGRAVGGGVEPFTDYLVGENGPEIVRIGSKGGVVASAASGSSPGGSVQEVHVTVGLVKDGLNILPEVISVAQQVASSAIGQYNKGVPSRIGQAQIRGTG